MTFEQDYNKLIDFAKKRLSGVSIDNLLPADLVNSAYLFFIDTGKEYTITAAENRITGFIKDECVRIKLPFNESKEDFELNDGDTASTSLHCHNDKATEAICCTCKETKPIGLFPYVYSNKEERKAVRNTCKDCVSKQVMKWAKNNPEKFKAYQKEYLQRTGKGALYAKKQYHKDIEKARAQSRERQRRFQQKKRLLRQAA